MISFEEAVHADPPQVWLNGFFGFNPECWAGLTYTDKSRLEQIHEQSQPGFLTVAYGVKTGHTPRELKRKILGIYRCSHETGDIERFLSPFGLQRKQEIQNNEKSWGHAFRIVEAWRTIPENAPTVSEFAHRTYSTSKGRNISRRSARLESEEALKILDLELLPCEVFGGNNDFEPGIRTGRDILSPSKAGPVSQSSFISRGSEGPKHLYILELDGPLDLLFDNSLDGKSVVKVGFSRSPSMRCDQFNRALPQCRLKWSILYSTYREGADPLADSVVARHGEDAMKHALADEGASLGGEFFLATPKQIKSAWDRAKYTAAAYSKEQR